MMEPIKCGARQRKGRCNSTEMVCSSPVSTSYGGSSPKLRDNVGTSSLCDHRAELEVKTPYFCVSLSYFPPSVKKSKQLFGVHIVFLVLYLTLSFSRRQRVHSHLSVLSKDVYFKCRARSLEICNLVLMHLSDTERGFQPGYHYLKFFNDTELGLLVF